MIVAIAVTAIDAVVVDAVVDTVFVVVCILVGAADFVVVVYTL